MIENIGRNLKEWIYNYLQEQKEDNTTIRRGFVSMSADEKQTNKQRSINEKNNVGFKRSTFYRGLYCSMLEY